MRIQTFEIEEFLHQVAKQAQGDYSIAFKLLGLVVYVAQEGSDALLTGKMISLRTYYRWLEMVKHAGWGDLLADARLRQVIQDYIWKRFAGLPIDQARDRVLRVVTDLVSETEARSINANCCQASAAVKDMAEGREAEPSALEVGAHACSLGEAATVLVLYGSRIFF